MKKPYIAIIFCALILAAFSVYFLGNGEVDVRESMSQSSRGVRGVAMPTRNEENEKMMIAPDYPMPPMGGGDDAMMIKERAIEYNSYHSVIVEDVASYTKNLKEFITSKDGQVLSASQGKSDRYNYANIYAKVPVAAFEQTTQKITENTQKIINESVNTADRTGEVVNNLEQTETLKAEITVKEAQLKEATVQSEKTRIQNEITALQRRVAMFEQQGENIQQQVEYATVQVTVANNERYFDPRAQGTFLEELKEALRSLKDTFYGLVVIAIWTAVYSVVLIPLFLVCRWLVNKVRSPNKVS